MSNFLQKFTKYAGFWTLEDIFTWEVGAVQISSMSPVLMVLQNDSFDVNDLEEATDKFDFGVKVDDNDTVEGVNTASVRDRFDFLPTFPGIFWGDRTIKLPWVIVFFSDFSSMMTLISLQWYDWFVFDNNMIELNDNKKFVFAWCALAIAVPPHPALLKETSMTHF
jgi:hypothetical protein